MRSASLFACIAVMTLTGVGAVGCSSSNSTPTSNDYDDLAQATAALSVQAGGGGEIGSMYASANLAVGITPGNVTVDASGSFNEVQAGVDYTFAISCTDVLASDYSCNTPCFVGGRDPNLLAPMAVMHLRLSGQSWCDLPALLPNDPT